MLFHIAAEVEYCYIPKESEEGILKDYKVECTFHGMLARDIRVAVFVLEFCSKVQEVQEEKDLLCFVGGFVVQLLFQEQAEVCGTPSGTSVRVLMDA